jgi:hypothetical protein
MGKMAGSRVLAMSGKRVVERAVRRALVSAGCRVESEPGDQPYDLYVLDVDRLDILRSPRPDAPVLAMATDLADDAVIMEVLERGLNNVIAKHSAFSVSEIVDESELITTCGKLLTGDIFGLDKYIASTNIHIQSATIKNSGERSKVVKQLGQFLEDIDCYRGLVTNIETCADELLMNAIFSAPRDASGHSKYQSLDRKTVFDLAENEEVTLNFACDGRYVLLSVTDHFGALSRDIALKYLKHGLNKEPKSPEEKAGGAGIGLSMVANSISQLVINVDPDQKTEVIATFYIRSGAKAFRSSGRSLNMFYL